MGIPSGVYLKLVEERTGAREDIGREKDYSVGS
jgi:hypothetical protein